MIHVGSNNVTYDNLGDDPNVIAEKIIQIGQRCIEYGVKDVIISSIFVKHSLKLSAFIRKINDELRVLCALCNFKFESNDNIIRKHLCRDGVHLTTWGTNILDDTFPDAQFKINNYQYPPFRRDRNLKGGGKIVYIR